MEQYHSSGSGLICSICYIQYLKPVQQYQLNRPLQICYQCWFTHIKTALTRITYQTGSNIISPFEGKPDIDVCQALNTLKPNQKTQLQQWLFKKYTTFTNDIQKCPSQACDYVFLSEKCRWKTTTNYNCPKCDVPLLPVSNFSLKGVLGYLYFLIFSSKCPKCQIPIQKTSGCPHMTCPCGHQFCWYCMKDYRLKAQNVYSPHQSRECAFIVMSKILLFFICIISFLLTMAGHQGFRSFIDVLSQIFFVFIKAVLLDFIIAAQILVGTVMISRHRHRLNSYVGFRRRTNERNTSLHKYIVIMIILNIGVGYILHQMGHLMSFVSILLGQFCLLMLIGLSIYLVLWSVQSWFDFIA